MKALVVGGTGFIGGAVVRALLADGEQVRVLARPRGGAGARALPPGVEVAQGDALDPAAVAGALTGCDTLFYVIPAFPAAHQVEQTVAATRLALDAALGAGVQRVVYTTGTRTIGADRGQVGTEATLHRGFYLTLEERAKGLGEETALSYVRRGLSVTVVNPAFVYGPGDPWPTGEYLLNAVNGKLPATIGARLTWVYFDDVGRGHVLAARRGRPGQRYILSGSDVDLVSFLNVACGLVGGRPVRRVPDWTAAVVAGASPLLGRSAPLSREMYREYIQYGVRVDGSLATRELGLAYTPLEEGLRRTILWHWEQGHIARKPTWLI